LVARLIRDVTFLLIKFRSGAPDFSMNLTLVLSIGYR